MPDRRVTAADSDPGVGVGVTPANPRPPKVPQSVLVVIHDGAGQVLLLQRADRPDSWQSVTGAKDHPLEDWTTTARREVAEETGIAVGIPELPPDALRDWGLENVYEIYPVWRHRYAPGVTHNTERVFELQVPAGLAPQLAPREHLQWAWLPWAEAAARCFSPSNAQAIRLLAERRGWPSVAGVAA